MRFRDIPQFISDGSYQVDMSWEYMVEWIDKLVKEQGLQLNPDFQRGHVWTEEQQIKFGVHSSGWQDWTYTLF